MEQTVRCPNCGTGNPAGQQFCGKCGAKLIAVVQQKIQCPKCGFQNIAGQQFCGSCGAGLAVAVQQAPVSQVQQAPTAPVQQTSAVPAKQEVPAKVVKPVVTREQVAVKPTWGLAWGLWWRLFILSLLIGGIIYLIAFVVILALGPQNPFTL
jgi:DNA-directed RNA polymerase subunit RPC12/RpoP